MKNIIATLLAIGFVAIIASEEAMPSRRVSRGKPARLTALAPAQVGFAPRLVTSLR